VEQRLTSRWLALVEASTKLRAQVRLSSWTCKPASA